MGWLGICSDRLRFGVQGVGAVAPRVLLVELSLSTEKLTT